MEQGKIFGVTKDGKIIGYYNNYDEAVDFANFCLILQPFSNYEIITILIKGEREK